MTMTIGAAIRLIKRVTPKDDPWTGADISEVVKTATDTDEAFAVIANAVVADELIVDNKDATIARLMAKQDEWRDEYLSCKRGLEIYKRANQRIIQERDESMEAGTFAQGIEAAAAYLEKAGLADDRKDRGMTLVAQALLVAAEHIRALSSTPQADPSEPTFGQSLAKSKKAFDRLPDGKKEDYERRFGRSGVSKPTLQVDPVREPSEAMLNAARGWSVRKYGNPIGNDAAIGCWQAMYDALAQKEPEHG